MKNKQITEDDFLLSGVMDMVTKKDIDIDNVLLPHTEDFDEFDIAEYNMPSMVMSFHSDENYKFTITRWMSADNNEHALDLAMSVIIDEGSVIDPSIRLDLVEKELMETGCWHFEHTTPKNRKKKILWCVMIYVPKRLIEEQLSIVIDEKTGRHNTIKNYLKTGGVDAQSN